NRSALMKEWINSKGYNAIAWLSVAIMIGLSLALIAISIREWKISLPHI
ncbi:MAG: hypothetical protein IT160_21270, partial [Bryobacterales bacterium]|nr:hypothetical protein [Bryobacterales bacterium]